jgi:hypothetical protein
LIRGKWGIPRMGDVRTGSTSRRLMIIAIGMAVAAVPLGGTPFAGTGDRADAAAPKAPATPPPLDTATASDWSGLVGRAFRAAGYTGSLTVVRVDLLPLPKRSTVYARQPFTVTFEASAGPLAGERIVRMTDPFGRVVDLYVGPSVAVSGRTRLSASFN